MIETEEDRKRSPQPRWHWSELRVGERVSVFHREFLIMDCDAFTRDWYTENNLEQPPAVPKAAKVVQEFKRKIPPHRGMPGSDEDSYQTVINPLAPKATTRDFVKEITNGGKVMRFQCKMISDLAEDEGRLFTVSFYLADDTILIYELPTRNTFAGLRADGCKFLERGMVKHPDGPHMPLPRYYTSQDARGWTPGSTVRIHGHTFEIVDCDGFTSNLQTGQVSEVDPRKNLILSQISDQIRRVGMTKEDQFTYFDRNDDGVITSDELFVSLKLLGIKLSEAEVQDIIDSHDLDRDGGLNMDEFVIMMGSTRSSVVENMRNPGKDEKTANFQAGLTFPRTSKVER